MTAAEQRANLAEALALAVTEYERALAAIRAAMLAECRGRVPPSPAELAAAMRRLVP